jgi:hypothetical protein
MPRRLICAFALISASLYGAMWPEQLWEHKRSSLEAIDIAPADKPVWDEYGLEVAEKAQYGGWKGIGYRLKDTTSALAVFQWLKPGGDARPSTLEKYAVQTATRAFLLKGNFVLDFVGRVPTQQEVDILHVQLARLDQSALPSLPIFMPAGAIPGSERYVIGPATLQKFEPRISPSIAAFSMGAEAQLARYPTPKGEANLALFYYPTPQIARDRLADFQKIPNAVAKRSGPIVAITLAAPDPDEAERLLAKVNYQATITWNQKPPKPEPSPAELLLGICINIGIILGGAILSGLCYGGIRVGWRKLRGRTEEDDAMLTLHLGD